MWKTIVAAAFALAASATQSQPASKASAALASPFHRGVNVLGYDPYWQDTSKRHFEWRHFTEIRKGGFDFVRLNLQAFRHMDAQNRLDPAWLAKLDDVIRNAERAGLGVLIDEHDFDQCSEDVPLCRAKLGAFWSQVAPRYAKAPGNVAFEILNEPHAKLDAANWNVLFGDMLALVRRSNPTRIVVVGPTSWNSLKELPTLKLADDRNLLVTFHYYEPFHFTHQGAPWVPEVTKLHGVTWGSDADRAALRADFDQVAAWSAANHRSVLLGEFGAYDKSGTPEPLRVAYTNGVRCEAERHGFSWAYWQFDSDFIVWNMKTNQWVQPIKQALIPGAGASGGGCRP
jgi:endoglucanase